MEMRRTRGRVVNLRPRRPPPSSAMFRNIGALWDADGYLIGGGGIAIESPVPPLNPIPGMLWFDPVSTQLFVWYDDGTSAQWVVAINAGGSGIQGAIIVSDTPPANPTQGEAWFDSVSTRLFVWYEDPTSGQWVQT